MCVSTRVLVGVWCLSITPFALLALAPAQAPRPNEVSYLALALVPWIVAAGLPRSARGDRPRSARGDRPRTARGESASSARRSSLALLAFALPPLAVGLALERELGRSLASGILFALGALACCAVLHAAAERALRAPRAAVLHAIAWMSLVPGIPLLRLALEQGGRPVYGDAPRWLAWIAHASPVWWIASAAQSAPMFPWAALGVCALLLAIAHWPLADRRAAVEQTQGVR